LAGYLGPAMSPATGMTSRPISGVGVSPKIGRRHLERVAVVYVRQSSMAQVREHVESAARQYALAEQAVALGWDPRDVAVIDADLGVSGRSTEGRDGFRALVARVCLGEVGAIFGLEISRLARSSAVWVPETRARYATC